MHGDNIWRVTHWDGAVKAETRVVAESWQVGSNGDLAFGNGLNGMSPFFTRAFAAGTWATVELYA